MDAARLLCIGDLHLGRRPTGLPAAADDGLRRRVGPRAVLRAACARAIAEGVDAVLFAGDVVESLEDRFEAFGALETAVRDLVEAGITVAGVAGNHDVHALPRLAQRIDGFHLLGAGGKWEAFDLPGPAGVRVRVHGWSFPEPRVRESPLAGHRFERAPGTVEIGLLHADLDQTRSPYAPVPRRELEAADLDAFLLGHVHGPSDLAAMDRPFGYLGSVTPLDPGEPGTHGPWLLEARGPSRVSIAQIPLAPLRFERIEVPVDGLEGGGEEVEEDLVGRLLDGLGRGLAAGQAAGGSTELVGCRLILCGRSPAHRCLRRFVEAQDDRLRSLDRADGGIRAYVEKVEDRAAAALDLERLAEVEDPPGLLAGVLLELERGEAQDLVARARDLLDAEGRAAHWAALPATGPDVEALLADVGGRLLEDLLASQERRA